MEEMKIGKKKVMLTKKIINSIALLVGLFGVCLTFIFGFILYGVIDGGEKVTLTQMDHLIVSIQEMEQSIGNIKDETANTEVTLTEFAEALQGFSESMEGIAEFVEAFEAVSDALGMGVLVGDMSGTSDSLLETADSLSTLSENFEAHGETIGNLGENMDDLKNNMKQQKENLIVGKSTVEQMFGGLKLSILLLVLILLSMFGVLIMVSVARLL